MYGYVQQGQEGTIYTNNYEDCLVTLFTIGFLTGMDI